MSNKSISPTKANNKDDMTMVLEQVDSLFSNNLECAALMAFLLKETDNLTEPVVIYFSHVRKHSVGRKLSIGATKLSNFMFENNIDFSLHSFSSGDIKELADHTGWAIWLTPGNPGYSIPSGEDLEKASVIKYQEPNPPPTIPVRTMARCDLPQILEIYNTTQNLENSETDIDLTINSKMSDGTVFAGISPETGMRMFRIPQIPSDRFTWNEAMEYVENLNAHGHSDWALPSINELKVLFNSSAKIGSEDNKNFYWSSIKVPDASDIALGYDSYDCGSSEWTDVNERMSAIAIRRQPC